MYGLKGAAMANDEGIYPMITKNGIKVMSINLLLPTEDTPVIWRGPVLANIQIDSSSLLIIISNKLEPIGNLIGLDGVMLMAFIIGLPANEIVLPIALMAYLSTSVISDYSSIESLKEILITNGWTVKTAICACIFSMFHFPCATTLFTIIKETRSIKYTLLSIITPLFAGSILCIVINLIF